MSGTDRSVVARAMGKSKSSIVGAVAIAALGAAATSAFAADADTIRLPDKIFPESITSTSDGTLYFGSFSQGGVMKVKPGGTAESFIKPGAGNSRSILGVLADEKNGILYACSNDATGVGVKGPSDAKGANLKTFDLKTGAPKGSFPLKEKTSFCNDIVVGPDGTAYVSDTFAPYVYSLRPGGTALEVWATDPQFAPAKKGDVGLDGLAFGADGNMLIDTFVPGQLFMIEVKDGKAGKITKLKPSRDLDRADAIRAYGDGFLLVEGKGTLDKVKVSGSDAKVETIAEGYAWPVGVTVVGDTAWVAQGQLDYLFGANKDKTPPPFELKSAKLSK